MDGCQVDEYAPSELAAPRKVPSLGISNQKKPARVSSPTGIRSCEAFVDDADRTTAPKQGTLCPPSQSAPNIKTVLSQTQAYHHRRLDRHGSTLPLAVASRDVRSPLPGTARLEAKTREARPDYEGAQSFGDVVESDTEGTTTYETVSFDQTPHVRTTPVRWYVSVAAASLCVGLFLVAIAAIGTTYTYKALLGPRIQSEAFQTTSSAVSAGNNESSNADGNKSDFIIDLNDDEYSMKRRTSAQTPWRIEADVPLDRAPWSKAGSLPKSPTTSTARHQLWCFVRRDALASGEYGFGRLPLGVCWAVVYQSVTVALKDVRVDLVSQDLDFDERRRGIEKLASLKLHHPSLLLYVQLGDPDRPPMVHPKDRKKNRDASRTYWHGAAAESLRTLLQSSGSVIEDFATGVSLWLSARHLDGLAVDLGVAVASLEPDVAGPNLTTHFAQICYGRLLREGLGFTLLLPEDSVLYSHYDLGALLDIGTLQIIQRSHYVSSLEKASCLGPHQALDFSVEHVVNRTLAAVRDNKSLLRVLFSVTFTGALFFLDDVTASEPTNVTAFMPATYRGFLPYREVCRRVLRGQWWAVTNLGTDCLEAGRGTEWASCFGPASGYWVVALKSSIRGIAVFDVDGDDFDGSCGERNVLLERLRDLLA